MEEEMPNKEEQKIPHNYIKFIPYDSLIGYNIHHIYPPKFHQKSNNFIL